MNAPVRRENLRPDGEAPDGSASSASMRAIPFLRHVLEAAATAAVTSPATAAGAASPNGAPSDNAAGESPDSVSGPDMGGTSRARLGDVVDRLDERAFGMMLLLLALPCCLPFVYVLPQIVALPMLALAGQLAVGRKHPWLPGFLSEREFDAAAFQSVLDRSEKYVGWVEAFARPRITAITSRHGARILGALLLAPCASILVPLPGTNTVPGIGVAIAALGFIERDGVLTCLGVVLGCLWVAALLIFGLEAASLLKDWLAARF